MSNDQRSKKLRQLQAEVDEIRRELGFSSPQAVLYLNWLNAVDDDLVVVEADGFGGALLRVTEGNYPIDFMAHSEERFETEAAAVEHAEQLVAAQARTSVT